MNKELIILTMSSKNENYCVAGIDKSNGEWIRLVSDDESINGALTKDDLMFEDGSICNILDIVRVQTSRQKPSDLQPENIEIDEEYYLTKLGTGTLQEIIKLHPAEHHAYILGNQWNYITDRKVYDIGHSLIFIEVFNITLHKELNKYGSWKTKINFTYNGLTYENLSVTDPDYFNMQNPIQLNKAYLVVSLPEVASNDKYYKCVAKIFIQDEKVPCKST